MIALALFVAQAAAQPLAAESTSDAVAFVCRLDPAGKTRPAKPPMNFGVLLASEPRGLNEPSVAILKTVDRAAILAGGQIVSFNDTGAGHFAALSGTRDDPRTMMLSLSRSTRGAWLDAGVVRYGERQAKYEGICFALKSENTAADFNDELPGNQK